MGFVLGTPGSRAIHIDRPTQSNPIQSNPIQSNPIQSNPTTLHSLLVLNYAVFVLYIAGCAYENAEADRGNGAKELRSVGRGASVDVVPEFVEQALVSMRNLQSLT
jgi:hypothetical protein